ncbi:hypothetical protein [Priestia koreensis]|uniref:hypothetical protein n=1 Tax=Priestia koreensis TaxID=284581 RepID=UPI001F589AD9|nr:hypothetical protein [Priestia koreensis]MCM3005341.1 hypothetical protein [Priestia koreensis]UNL86555.1 hypothetical protein IE339_08730 [Priestia koreensis]
MSRSLTFGILYIFIVGLVFPFLKDQSLVVSFILLVLIYLILRWVFSRFPSGHQKDEKNSLEKK